MNSSGLFAATLLAEGDAAAPSPFGGILPLLPLIVVAFIFIVWRPQKRERMLFESMLKSLKKNDRILTTGGMYGVVVNVQPEANELTIRIDETNNTKVRILLTSVAKVLGGDAPAADAKDAK